MTGVEDVWTADPSAARPGPSTDLAELVETLWPAPIAWSLGTARDTSGRTLVGDLVVMPSVEHPRVILPRNRSMAAAVTRASSSAHTPTLRLRGTAMTTVVRVGLAPLFGTRLRLWSDGGATETIERHLTDVLGQPVTVSVRLGPPRANRKPVLHVLSARREVVAVAKVGTSDLSRALVAAESAALRMLAARSWRSVTVPRLLHEGTWRETSLLVQSALLAPRPRPLTGQRRLEAMREVAESGGALDGVVATSTYAEGLAARIRSLPDPALSQRMLAALRGVAHGSLRFGAWHGDWTDWNTAAGDGSVLIWDWERHAKPVPVGMDALHHAAQPVIVRAGGPTPADALALLDASPRDLAPFGIDPERARVVASLYLLELGARYAADDQAAAGVPAGRIDSWILPAIEHDLTSTPTQPEPQ